MIQSTRTSVTPVLLFVIGAVLLLEGVGGCSILDRRASDQGTVSDRLMEAYPDLESGRFAVLADFENPSHMELVQFISVTPGSSCKLDARKGRRETGRGCVAIDCGSDADTLVLNNQHAHNWYLKRDWQDFDLLLLSIFVPRAGLHAEIQISSGSGTTRLSVQSSVPLDQKWNLIRLDLAEIGEHLPLDDIQEIRVAFSGLAHPVRAYIDDILLACNRHDLFGDSENRLGRLYVRQVGRRWSVGAGGRFELTFANGQIVQWFNLASDPYRLRNLVQGTTLGPSPVELKPGVSHGGDFAGFGNEVIVHPRLLEVNKVRVVVSSEWRYVDKQERGALDSRPFQRWTYTIYPTGQVYVDLEFTAATAAWSPGPLGVAATMAGGADELETHWSDSNTSESSDQPVYAAIHNRSAEASLLFAPAAHGPNLKFIESPDETGRRISLIAARSGESKEVERWDCHVFLSDDGSLANDEAGARASEYQQPNAPRLQLGSLATAGKDFALVDGFDPATGACTIVPDRGRVRLFANGRSRPLFNPVYRIINSSKAEAQVYVNHAVFEQFDYDSEGNVLLQLPEIIKDKVLVEIFFRSVPNKPVS